MWVFEFVGCYVFLVGWIHDENVFELIELIVFILEVLFAWENFIFSHVLWDYHVVLEVKVLRVKEKEIYYQLRDVDVILIKFLYEGNNHQNQTKRWQPNLIMLSQLIVV